MGTAHGFSLSVLPPGLHAPLHLCSLLLGSEPPLLYFLTDKDRKNYFGAKTSELDRVVA